jgi:RNA polymerase sigma factor (sigma-70 family)
MADHASQNGHWFRTVVDRYEGPLVRYAARITGDVDRARDVVQDAFLRLHRELLPLPRGEGRGEGAEATKTAAPTNVQAWLYTVCRRRALDVLRKETRMKTLDDSQVAVCESPRPAQHAALEQQETEHRLLQLLAELPLRDQEVVRLKFQDGLSYRDIAEVMGLSASNVGYVLHMAIKRLRVQLTASETGG